MPNLGRLAFLSKPFELEDIMDNALFTDRLLCGTNKYRNTITVLVGASLVLISSNGIAQIISNGSFESPAIPDGTYHAPPPTSWIGGVFLDNPNATGKMAGLGFTWPQAANGQQYIDIGDTASTALSQAFVLTGTGTFTLSWQDNTGLNIIPGYQTAPYAVRLVNGSAQQVFIHNFDSWRASGVWQARSIAQALSSDTYTISFTSLNYFNGTDTLIDTVQISSVPEPTDAILLSLGLAGLFAFRARQRNSSKVA